MLRISRRNFIKTLGLGTVSAFVPGCFNIAANDKNMNCSAVSSIHSKANQDSRPNVLFIFADDWGWGDLSCHNHPYVKTPNIDCLAKEGTDFTKFTVASGVCSPSRTAVMTGHFPARYNINGHFAWVETNQKRNMPDWLSPTAPLLPRFLKDSGYATAHYGKWHLANNMIPDSPLPIEYGYDEYSAFNCAGEQMPPHDDARFANKFIRKSHKQGKPFFINLWMHESHTPFHTLPKYRWRFPDLKEADNIYASVLSHADDRIGEVLDTLDELKIADNTLVIFTSDNGPARTGRPTPLGLMHDTATGVGYGIGASKGVTGGRKGYKASLFEGGIGVPFIAKWPGRIKAGAVNNSSLISAVDLLPTFCRIAGAKLPADYKPDGLCQLDALLGKNITDKRSKPLFWKISASWPVKDYAPDHWVAYAVVYEKWKLVSNEDRSHIELYDIVKDTYEKNDLKTQNPQVVKKLVGMIDDWKTELPKKPSSDCFSKTRKS
jgi:arylsulfatase A-like enzyme